MADFSLNVQFTAFENLSKTFENIKAKTAGMQEAMSKTTGVFGQAGRSFEQLTQTQKQLHSQLGQVQAVAKQEQALSQLANQMQAARSKARDLKQQLKHAKETGQSEKAVRKLATAYGNAKQSAQSLFNKHKAMNQTLAQQKQKLNEAGLATGNLSQLQTDLEGKIQRTTQALNQQANRLNRFQKAQQSLAKWGKRSEKWISAGSGMSIAGQGMMTLGKGIFGTMASMAEPLGEFVKTKSKFEQYQGVLETFAGSSEKAKESLAWIQDYSAESSYGIEEVMQAFIDLKTYGMEPTKGLMTTLGDAAAAMSKPMSEAVKAMQNAIVGKNKDLREFGIMTKEVGNKIIYTYEHAGKKIRKVARKGNKKSIETTVTEIFNQKYAGSTKGLTDSFDGIIARLQSMWTRFQIMVMDSGLFDIIKEKLSGVVDMLNQMSKNGELQAWAKDVGDTLADLFASAWEFGQWLFGVIKSAAAFVREHKTLVSWGIKAAAVFAGLSIVFGGLLMSLGGVIAFVGTFGLFASKLAMFKPVLSVILGLKTAFVGLFTVLKTGFLSLLANPAILIFLGIAAAVAGIAYLIYRNWDWLKGKLIALWEGLSAFFSQFWETLKQLAQLAFDGLAILFTEFSPLALLMKGFHALFNYLGTVLPESLTGFFGKAFDSVCETIANIDFLTPLKNALTAPLDWASNAFSRLFGGEDSDATATGSEQSEGWFSSMRNSVKGWFGGDEPASGEIAPAFSQPSLALAPPNIQIARSEPLKKPEVQQQIHHGATTINVQVAKTTADEKAIAAAVDQALQNHQSAINARHRRRLMD